jgi:hypothetical protein
VHGDERVDAMKAGGARLWAAVQGTQDTLFTSASDLIRAGQEHELKCPRCARGITRVQRGGRFWLAVYDGVPRQAGGVGW